MKFFQSLKNEFYNEVEEKLRINIIFDYVYNNYALDPQSTYNIFNMERATKIYDYLVIDKVNIGIDSIYNKFEKLSIKNLGDTKPHLQTISKATIQNDDENNKYMTKFIFASFCNVYYTYYLNQFHNIEKLDRNFNILEYVIKPQPQKLNEVNFSKIISNLYISDSYNDKKKRDQMFIELSLNSENIFLKNLIEKKSILFGENDFEGSDKLLYYTAIVYFTSYPQDRILKYEKFYNFIKILVLFLDIYQILYSNNDQTEIGVNIDKELFELILDSDYMIMYDSIYNYNYDFQDSFKSILVEINNKFYIKIYEFIYFLWKEITCTDITKSIFVKNKKKFIDIKSKYNKTYRDNKELVNDLDLNINVESLTQPMGNSTNSNSRAKEYLMSPTKVDRKSSPMKVDFSNDSVQKKIDSKTNKKLTLDEKKKSFFKSDTNDKSEHYTNTKKKINVKPDEIFAQFRSATKYSCFKRNSVSDINSFVPKENDKQIEVNPFGEFELLLVIPRMFKKYCYKDMSLLRNFEDFIVELEKFNLIIQKFNNSDNSYTQEYIDELTFMAGNIQYFNANTDHILEKFPYLVFNNDYDNWISDYMNEFHVNKFLILRGSNNWNFMNYCKSQYVAKETRIPDYIKSKGCTLWYCYQKNKTVFKIAENLTLSNVLTKAEIVEQTIDKFNIMQNKNIDRIDFLYDQTRRFEQKIYTSNNLISNRTINDLLWYQRPHYSTDCKNISIKIEAAKPIVMSHFYIEVGLINGINNLHLFGSTESLNHNDFEQYTYEERLSSNPARNEYYLGSITINKKSGEMYSILTFTKPVLVKSILIRIIDTHTNMDLNKTVGFSINKIKIAGIQGNNALYGRSINEVYYDMNKDDVIFTQTIHPMVVNPYIEQHLEVIRHFPVFLIEGDSLALDYLKYHKGFDDSLFFHFIDNDNSRKMQSWCYNYSKDVKQLLMIQASQENEDDINLNKKSQRDYYNMKKSKIKVKTAVKVEKKIESMEMNSLLLRSKSTKLKNGEDNFDAYIAFPPYLTVAEQIREICIKEINFDKFIHTIIKNHTLINKINGNKLAELSPNISDMLFMKSSINSQFYNHAIGREFYAKFIFFIYEILVYYAGCKCKLIKFDNPDYSFVLKMRLSDHNIQFAAGSFDARMRVKYMESYMDSLSLARKQGDRWDKVSSIISILNGLDTETCDPSVVEEYAKINHEDMKDFDELYPMPSVYKIEPFLKNEVLPEVYMTYPICQDETVMKIYTICESYENINPDDFIPHCNFMLYGAFNYFTWGNNNRTSHASKVFRQVDRIEMINKMIKKNLNIEYLQNLGLLYDYNSVHSQNDLKIIHDNILNWYKIYRTLNIQELTLINEYYGAEIAFYFNFISLYVKFLMPLSFFGLLFYATKIAIHYWYLDNYYYIHSLTIDIVIKSSYSIIILCGSMYFSESLKASESYFSYIWAVSEEDYDREDDVRNNFDSVFEYDIINDIYIRTREINYMIYPIYSIIWLLIIVSNYAIIHEIVHIKMQYHNTLNEDYTKLKDQAYDWAMMIAMLLVTKVFSTMWDYVVNYVVDAEKHKYNTDYYDSMANKKFYFRFFSDYAPLFVVMFYFGLIETDKCMVKRFYVDSWIQMPPGSERLNYYNSCMSDIGRILYQYFCIYLLMNFYELIDSFLRIYSRNQHFKENCKADLIIDEEEDQYSIQYDLMMKENDPIYDEYFEIMNQMGLLCIFGLTWEWASLLCLITDLLEIRVDAYKIMKCSKRGMCSSKKSLTIYLELIENCTTLFIILNIYLLYQEFYSIPIFNEILTFQNIFAIFVAIENLVLFLKIYIMKHVDDVDWRVRLWKSRDYIQQEDLKKQLTMGKCFKPNPSMKIVPSQRVEQFAYQKEYYGEQVEFDKLIDGAAFIE